MSETLLPPQHELMHAPDVLFSKEESMQHFGINGELDACIQIGNSRFGVFQVAEEEQGRVTNVFRDNPEMAVLRASHLIVQLDESLKGGPVHAKALREGKPEILGREHLTDRFTYDRLVSRTHAQIELVDGQVKVTDLQSLNGTQELNRDDMLALFDYEKQGLITEVPQFLGVSAMAATDMQPEFIYKQPALEAHADSALEVEPYELVRDRGNNGKELDKGYIDNQTALRKYFVDSLRAGALYGDARHFTERLQKAHRIASTGDYYERVGTGQHGVEPGVIRDYDMENSRLKEALQIYEVARQYGDDYYKRFLTEGYHEIPIVLEGIAETDSPHEELTVNGGLTESYKYVYPDHDATDSYMEQIDRVGQDIQRELERPEPDKARVLEMIAQQYQYGAVARPFKQINNSVFMNLANTQLKLLGLHGVTHGNLDFAAQRLSTKTFKEYFLNCVWAQQ